MEGLRADREDLDQFKGNHKKTSAAAAPKKVRKAAKANAPVSYTSPLIVIFIVALLGANVFFAWTYTDQQAQVAKMEAQLEESADFIGRSKLLMARFEGELNVTGVEMEQSGTAVQSKLAFLDSEMRKLWGVSNDRNKKLIQDNTGAVNGLSAKLEKITQQQTREGERNKIKSVQQQAALDSLSSTFGVLQTNTSKLDSRISMVANEAVITRDEQEGVLGAMEQELAQVGVLSKQFGVLSKQFQESKKAIASIDASRRQLNERVVGLERKLNKLQLKLKPAPKSPDVQ